MKDDDTSKYTDMDLNNLKPVIEDEDNLLINSNKKSLFSSKVVDKVDNKKDSDIAANKNGMVDNIDSEVLEPTITKDSVPPKMIGLPFFAFSILLPFIFIYVTLAMEVLALFELFLNFSDSTSGENTQAVVFIYVVIAFVGFVTYFIYFFKNLDRINFRFLNYPLVLFNFLLFGRIVLPLIVPFVDIIWPLLLIVSVIVGIVLGLKSSK